MKKIFKEKILLLLIIASIAAFLRFWQLGQNPPSLTWDEVAWGYNAYSLGIDGRDEFGKFLPIQYLESFGDFKPPLYAYLDILPVKIFGLNEFAVRFPSALFGVLTVLVTYFLVKRIFGLHELPRTPLSGTRINTNYFALLSAFFLAISPWHINLSRAAFEANAATFFLVTGVWLFLGGVGDKRWYLPLSVISLVLSMYTFNTARVVAPLLVAVLAFGFYKELLKAKKYLAITLLSGIIFVLPLAHFLLTPQAQLRFREVNIFADIGIIERTNQEMANDQSIWWSKILHNRRFAYGIEFLKHYFDNFNPSFLFIKGDGNPKFSTQDVGQLYLWDLPFLIFGILLLFKKREGVWWLIPLWLIIGIAPAGTARETPHALRIENTLPTWQILIAYGFVQMTSQAKRNKKFLLSILYCLLFINFLYYFHGYWTHYPREFSREWQYGYRQAISYVQSVQDQYDKVLFTDELGRPYIYLLFYLKENPANFRESAQIWREAFGFVHVEGFGKYRFTQNLEAQKVAHEKTLFINIPKNTPENLPILKSFSLLDSKTVLVAYTL